MTTGRSLAWLRDQQKQGTLLAIVSGGLLPILAGYLIVQGPFLNAHLYFTPWHHDEFDALSMYRGISFWIPRPISSNIVAFMGSFGPNVYYVFVTVLWMTCLSLTHLFAVRAFRLNLAAIEHLLYAFIGSMIWHLQSSSVQSVQYLGLVTNALSYFFGILASLLFLNMRNIEFSSRSYLVFATAFLVLGFLAAFSKEDMGPFLALTVLWSAIPSEKPARPDRAKHIVLGLILIAGCYGASILHSIFTSSPIFGGTGPYDLNGFAGNSFRNLVFYLAPSPATMVLFIFFGLAVVLLGVATIWIPSAQAIFRSSLFVVLCSLALMAPYLILPRQFDYYAMNFVPILSFSVVPLLVKVASLVTTRVMVAQLCGIILALLGTVELYRLDVVHRSSTLAWMRMTRERSFQQLEEISRAADELRDCDTVRVSGVSESFGPFLATSDIYLTKLLGKEIVWKIEASPGTLLDQWSHSRDFGNHLWFYIAEGEQESGPACRFRVDPKTNKADFTPAP
jgi:hypothetical protein